MFYIIITLTTCINSLWANHALTSREQRGPFIDQGTGAKIGGLYRGSLAEGIRERDALLAMPHESDSELSRYFDALLLALKSESPWVCAEEPVSLYQTATELLRALSPDQREKYKRYVLGSAEGALSEAIKEHNATAFISVAHSFRFTDPGKMALKQVIKSFVDSGALLEAQIYAEEFKKDYPEDKDEPFQKLISEIIYLPLTSSRSDLLTNALTFSGKTEYWGDRSNFCFKYALLSLDNAEQYVQLIAEKPQLDKSLYDKQQPLYEFLYQDKIREHLAAAKKPPMSFLKALAKTGDVAVKMELAQQASNASNLEILEILVSDIDPRVREIIAKGIGKHGEKLVHPLIEKLEADCTTSIDSAKTLALMGKASIPSFKRLVESPSLDTRFCASHGLALLKEDGLSLLKILATDKNKDVRENTAKQLGAAGPGAVPILELLAQDSEEEVREAAIYSLSEIGPAALSTLTKLLSTRRQDPELRKKIITALGEIGEEALPILEGLYQDPAIQVEIAEALGSCGIKALPKIEELARGKNYLVRLKAISSASQLGKIGIPLVENFLFNPNDYKPEQMVEDLLAELGPDGFSIARRLATDPDANLRRASVNTLAEVGGPEAFTLIMQLSADETPRVRAMAAEALENFPFIATQPALERLSRDPKENVRLPAILALGKGGTAALPLLKIHMLDSNPRIRTVVGKALVRMGEAGLTNLALLANDPDLSVRQNLAQDIASFGTKLLPSIEKLSRDPVRLVRQTLVTGLANNNQPIFSVLGKAIREEGVSRNFREDWRRSYWRMLSFFPSSPAAKAKTP